MATDTDAVHQLLERDHELETLSAAAGRAARGAGGVVLIEGPPGVGKSRLLASARASGRELGMQVLEGRGAVLEREFAFGVARQLFEEVVTPNVGEQREDVFAGAAGLAATLLGDADAGLPPGPGDASFGALHGLYWLTVNLTDEGSVLISVDDVQWSDRSSLSFLNYLSRRLEGLPVLLVAAGRSPDPEGDELWRQLAEDPVAEVIRPHPLSEAATADVVRHRLGPEAHDEFCRACHRATRGNPLFLRELVRALADAHVAPTEDAAGAVTEIGPSAVSRFVLHRLERLGSSATALARAVAVLGEDVDVGLAAEVAGTETREARAVADLLVQADVFAPDQKLAFAHPVVRAAVYEDLMPGERTAGHLAVARLLDDNGAPAERAATHLLQCEPAGDDRWVAVLRSAAANAVQRGDPGVAVTYLRRALEEPPSGNGTAKVLCDLGRWELANRDFESANKHLSETLRIPGEPEVHARAAVWLSRSAISFGGPEEARVALDATLAQLETAEGELALELDAEALALARFELSLRPLAPERLAGFQRRASGHGGFESVARIHAALERMIHGEAATTVADEIEAALAGGAPPDQYALGMAIDALIATDRPRTAARWLDLGLGAARALGLGTQLAALYTQSAALAFATGALGDAELDARTGLDLAAERHILLPRTVAVAIQVAIERGDLDSAEELADRYGEIGERERVLVDEFLTCRGRLRVLRGEVREGLVDLQRCGQLLEAYGVSRPAEWRPEAARAFAQLGDRRRARELSVEAVAAARKFGAPRTLARATRAAGTVIGGSEGLDLLEEAVAAVEHTSARLEAAYAFADLGAELVKQRRRREGREVLRLGIDRAVACGATALADRIRGDLGAGGGRPPRLELSGVDALTPAERRVCDLAASELTNREVAQRLFVTEKTVELHLTNAYRKLGIRSRFQLASVIQTAVASD